MEQARTRREAEVWRVCDELWAQSGSLQSLTGDAIRERLLALGYKKGSPNEIYKYRYSWKLSRHITEETNSEQSLENEDPIGRAVALVREELRLRSQKVLDEKTEEFATSKEEWGQEKKSLALAIESLEKNGLVLEKNKENLEKELSNLRAQLQQTEHQLQEAHFANERLQVIAAEQTAHFGKERALYSEHLARLREAHQQELQRIKQDEEKRHAVVQEKIERLKEELASLGAQAMEESNELKIEVRNKMLEIKRLMTENQQLLLQHAHLSEQLNKQDKHQQGLLKNNERLIEALAKAKDILFEESKEKKRLQQKASVAEKEALTLREELQWFLKKLKQLPFSPEKDPESDAADIAP